MKIAVAQINPTVGDLEGNVARILAAVKQVAPQAPDLIAFPEMVLTGYPPRDILLDESFPPAAMAALDDLAEKLTGFPPVLLGSLAFAETTLPQHPNLYNAAWLIQAGRPQLVAAKRLLPAYDVFHEPRWFIPGGFFPPLEIEKRRIGILICEDLWDEGYPIHPAAELKAAGAEILICLAASPYRQGVGEQRLYHVRRSGLPTIFVNTVGANDELIFDGRSFVVNGAGEVADELVAFEEQVQVLELGKSREREGKPLSVVEELHQALVLGILDFAHKNGMKQAVIGLSGGIDSAVAAVLAVEALGAENIIGVAIPSRFTNPRSTESAKELCTKLGCRFEVLELESLHHAAELTLGDLLSGTGAENVQARLRMTILMSYVNRLGGFLLNTSNKTELTVGYSTLYGDLAGTLSPLGDLTKPQLYELGHFVGRDVIPAYVFERLPSAELRAEQVDPFDYETFSPQMEALVQANQSDRAMRQAEHKRWQAGIILKVSEKAFGSGRMIPVTRK